MKPAQRIPSIRHAAITVGGVAASFGCTYALCRWCHAQSGPAILAAILALSFARRPHAMRGVRLLLVPPTIAGMALAATGVALLLHAVPLLGAIVFCGGMWLSIWLRNFGERVRSLGTLIALPLAAILIAPARAYAPGGIVVDVSLAISAGVIAFAFVTAFGWLGERAGIAASAPLDAPARPAARARTGWSPTTRLALQMLVALSFAFSVGWIGFGPHWAWCVLTAFIVSSGARSRGDAVYKGVLRLGGALGGTVAAALLARTGLPGGVAEAVTIFVVLFAGIALREVSYAYWAACMTLVLTLVAQPGAAVVDVLGVRLEAILTGAVCAVLAAWYVMPITVEAIIRRRLADALAALDEFVANSHAAEPERTAQREMLAVRMAELEEVAPPARWHRRLFVRTTTSVHPASWIDLAHRVHARAATLDATNADERRRGSLRRAIGASRKAIALHGKPDAPPETVPVGSALQRVHDLLESA